MSKFEPAGAAEILRSSQKDEEYMHVFRQLISDISQSFIGWVYVLYKVLFVLKLVKVYVLIMVFIVKYRYYYYFFKDIPTVIARVAFP